MVTHPSRKQGASKHFKPWLLHSDKRHYYCGLNSTISYKYAHFQTELRQYSVHGQKV